MNNAFTLDDLNQALEVKYAPFVFHADHEIFTLQQVLRLPKNKREVVKAQLQMLDDKREDLTEDDFLVILKAIVENVLEDPGYGKADRLFAILDNDIAKITVLFEKWVEKSQPGEA
jgi:hypothetical protein